MDDVDVDVDLDGDDDDDDDDDDDGGDDDGSDNDGGDDDDDKYHGVDDVGVAGSTGAEELLFTENDELAATEVADGRLFTRGSLK